MFKSPTNLLCSLAYFFSSWRRAQLRRWSLPLLERSWQKPTCRARGCLAFSGFLCFWCILVHFWCVRPLCFSLFPFLCLVGVSLASIVCSFLIRQTDRLSISCFSSFSGSLTVFPMGPMCFAMGRSFLFSVSLCGLLFPHFCVVLSFVTFLCWDMRLFVSCISPFPLCQFAGTTHTTHNLRRTGTPVPCKDTKVNTPRDPYDGTHRQCTKEEQDCASRCRLNAFPQRGERAWIYWWSGLALVHWTGQTGPLDTAG